MPERARNKTETRGIPSNEHFRFYGIGEMGDKAAQLVAKTPKLIELGFHVPHRSILRQSILDKFFQQNKLGKKFTKPTDTYNLEARIVDPESKFDEETQAIFSEIAERYKDIPIMVRSSAKHDARGTGIYQSVATFSTLENIAKAVKEVMASYYSDSAIVFRKRLGSSSEGFGIMIEPMVGQKLETETKPSIYQFSTLLSGIAYTSSQYGEGYITAVAGLGGGVDDADKIIRIQPSNIASFPNLGEYLRTLIKQGRRAYKRASLLDLRGFDAKYYIPVNIDDPFYNRMPSTTFDVGSNARRLIGQIDLRDFFAKFQSLENTFHSAQYIEWAVTTGDNGEYQYHILQIADTKKEDEINLDIPKGEPFLSAQSVRGSKVAECKKIVWATDDLALQTLHLFNNLNQKYILIISPRALRSFGGNNKIGLDYFSNALAIIENAESTGLWHSRAFASHFTGSLKELGIVTGALYYDDELHTDIDEAFKTAGSWRDLKVNEGRFVLHADERNDRLIIYKD